MQNSTRVQFEKFLSRVATLNGVSSTANSFAVEPSVQQTLEKKMQLSSAFLQSINVFGVKEMTGQKIGLGVNSTIASRTNTTNKDRTPMDVSDLGENNYTCKETHFDTAYTYAMLDAWAKFPDFQAKLRDAIIKQQALDRIMIGFNGISIAADTDRTTNPLLQDVNIGWLQKYRTEAAERVLTEGSTTGLLSVGPGGDYENLDALVYDVVNNLIAEVHQERTDLIVLCGRKLLNDKYFPLINKDNAPTEANALDTIVSAKRLGGLQATRAPFVPDGALMVTPLKNLSIYFQEQGRRRYLSENPKRSRIENYESSNDAYVIEDYSAGCLVENIGAVPTS